MLDLILIRHAKSSWKYSEIMDTDRPLSEKGIIKMRQVLTIKKKEVKEPEIILTSTANRAIHTALILAEHFKMDPNNILIEKDLYESNVQKIIDVIKKYSDYSTIAITAHDPSLTETVNFLTNETLDKIPTSGIVHIHFNDGEELKKGKGKLAFKSFEQGPENESF